MRCVLHVGPTKTGSTSIQQFLRKNEQALNQQGFVFPRLSQWNMAEYSYAFKSELTATRSSRRLGINPENHADLQQSYKQKLDNRISKAKDRGAHTILISSEALSNIGLERVSNREDLDVFQNWLAQRFDDILIVIVLRRQDLRAVSRYKNQVRNRGLMVQNALEHTETMSLGNVFKRWGETFGQRNIKPILFPDSVDEPRNLLSDFCETVGVNGSDLDGKSFQLKRNSSIDGRAIEVLRLLNVVRPKEGFDFDDAKMLRFHKILEQQFSDSSIKAMPSEDQARYFMSNYEKENEEIQRIYFPERQTLFKQDFSMYPTEENYPTFDDDDVFRLLSALIHD